MYIKVRTFSKSRTRVRDVRNVRDFFQKSDILPKLHQNYKKTCKVFSLYFNDLEKSLHT